jgi:hypothetical protein
MSCRGVMVLRNIVGTPFGPDGVQSTDKKSHDRLNCKGAIDDFVRQIMRGSRIGTQPLQIRDGRIACKEITLQYPYVTISYRSSILCDSLLTHAASSQLCCEELATIFSRTHEQHHPPAATSTTGPTGGNVPDCSSEPTVADYRDMLTTESSQLAPRRRLTQAKMP